MTTEAPTTAPTPETPTPAPETPTTAPETPTPAPETPTPAPETPTPAPEVDYAFTVPEGFTLGDEVADFTAIAKDLKLPVEGAQKIVDLAVKREQARVAAHVQQVKAWADELAADKDIGGANTKDTKVFAAKALALAPPGLREMLDASGLGNYPPMVKWARAVGKALSEDSHVPATAAVPESSQMADRLYGNTKSRT